MCVLTWNKIYKNIDVTFAGILTLSSTRVYYAGVKNALSAILNGSRLSAHSPSKPVNAVGFNNGLITRAKFYQNLSLHRAGNVVEGLLIYIDACIRVFVPLFLAAFEG